jgi:PAS domain S-box-containing protein
MAGMRLAKEGLKKDNRREKIRLHESEERLRRLAENATDMIYRMSLPDGHYEYVSPASIDLFGYAPQAFYGSPLLIQKVIHPDWVDYFKEQWTKLLSGNMPPFYEYQIRHKSGEERWLHQRNDQGHITYVSPVGLKIWGGAPCEIIGSHFIELVHAAGLARGIGDFKGAPRGHNGGEQSGSRMSGWETLAALRQLSPGLPVILASGHDEGKEGEPCALCRFAVPYDADGPIPP